MTDVPLSKDQERLLQRLTGGMSTLRDGLTEVKRRREDAGMDTSETDAGLNALEGLVQSLAANMEAQFMSGIDGMIARVFDNARMKGFWPDGYEPSNRLNAGRNDGEAIALMHSELSELLEARRDTTFDTGTGELSEPMSEKIPGFTHAEEEAADVIIRLFDLAGGRGWRLAQAIIAKHNYNIERPHKHDREL